MLARFARSGSQSHPPSKKSQIRQWGVYPGGAAPASSAEKLTRAASWRPSQFPDAAAGAEWAEPWLVAAHDCFFPDPKTQ